MQDRRLIIMLSVSVGLHLAAILVLLLLLRPPVPLPGGPVAEAEVELVMEEHKGDLAPPNTPSPAHTEQPAEKADEPSPDTPPVKPPIEATAEAPEEIVTPAQQSVAAQEPVQPQEKAQAVPKITLSGTDSPSEARAYGDHVLPARPDAVFHNRPPEYPIELAMAGQHGTVILAIHVAPSGRPSAVDVITSSGFLELDELAREAVMKWRFLPAVKDGQPVASEMAMQFYFDNSR